MCRNTICNCILETKPARTDPVTNVMHMNYKFLLSFILIIYSAICFIVYFIQDKLIFFPRSIDKEIAEKVAGSQSCPEEVYIDTPEGVKLHGWFYRKDADAPVLLYFGGNAEEVSWLHESHEFPEDWSLLFMNYRGYGLSEGKPSEENLKKDALLIFDHMLQKMQITPSAKVVMGRSLGTAVATHVAAHRHTDAVILVSPFESILQIARSTFPFLPVKLMLRHPFHTAKDAVKVNAPLLCFIAENDQVVPPSSTLALYEAWSGENELVVVPHHDHNTIMFELSLWQDIRLFLRKITRN